MMRLLSISALLLATLTTGCKQQVLCPALGSCGGPRDQAGNTLPPLSVTGDSQAWVLAPGHPSCIEDLYIPASDPRLQGGNNPRVVPTTGMTYPEPAVFDWCILLVTGPASGVDVQVRPPRYYYESGPIGDVSLKFQPDGHFSAGITRTGTFTLDFPAYCIRAFGAQAGPLDPSDPNSVANPVNVCKRLEVPVGTSGLNEGSYRNITCEENTDAVRAAFGLDGPADPLGCVCRFDVTETAGPAGTYQLKNHNTIVFFPDAVASNFPQNATFCQQGDRLEMTGEDGLYLFDQRGVRTFDLVRACAVGTDCVSGVCEVNAATGKGICK